LQPLCRFGSFCVKHIIFLYFSIINFSLCLFIRRSPYGFIYDMLAQLLQFPQYMPPECFNFNSSVETETKKSPPCGAGKIQQRFKRST
jgi:hypothetical protein